MLRAGHSAAEAARATGLTKGAISQDGACAEIIEVNRHAAMLKVDRLVKAGVTWRGACEEYGVTQSGYSKWRKREGLKNAQTDS